MPRKAKKPAPKKTFHVSDQALWQRLREHCTERGSFINGTATRAIREYLDRVGK